MLMILAAVGAFPLWVGASLLAQAEGTQPDWLAFTNLGAVGVILILFVTGRLHSEKAMAEVRRERDDAVADARKLRDALISEAVPAITRVTEVATRATEVLAKGPRR